MKSKRYILMLCLFFIMILLAACSNGSQNNNNGATNENANGNENEPLEIDGMVYDPPNLDELDPDDPMTEMIEYGESLFNETDTVAADYVGGKLSCQSCHADGGLSQASSMVGVTTQFPQYRPREGRDFTIEARINGCMVRSMNGEMFEEDSEEMRAMVAYLTKISEGIEVGADIPWRMQNTMEEIPEPDVVNGEDLYEKKNCMTCHATDGSGTGANSGPAVWGDDSFNDGAGINRLSKMAGYLQNNMPKGQEDLTDQEAADLAAYLLSKERPEWDKHDEDWPDGGRPTDIITKDRREEIRNGTFDWTEIENVIPKE